MITPGVGGILGTTIGQYGTSQHDGSVGSGFKEQPAGTLEYLEHLKFKKNIQLAFNCPMYHKIQSN